MAITVQTTPPPPEPTTALRPVAAGTPGAVYNPITGTWISPETQALNAQSPVGSTDKQLANQGFTWVKDAQGRYQRSDAYNPDTGKLLFPDLNGGQTISPQFNQTQPAQSGPFVIGGTATGQPAASSTATSAAGGAAASDGSRGSLSNAQQALLKALLDQQERDGITDEMRMNASELYDRTQGYEQDALRDIRLFTGGNSGIYNRYQPDIENDVGMAVADARQGQTAALNAAARQAMRYGINMPNALGGVSSTQASQLASAANNTRNNAINNYRGLVGQGIGLKEGTFRTSQAGTADAMGRAEAASMAGRNMRIQDDSLEWAKQLDVAGMARGMPGASQGAYGVAVGAGNSAVQNQMAPGNALIGAMGQANNTTMQGQQLQMQGLNGILGAQTSYANANAGGGDTFGSLLGGIGGAAAGLAKLGVFS